MCVSISATVALVCLFGPKVYIVLFQPHKNIRQGSTPGFYSGSHGYQKPCISDCNTETYSKQTDTQNGHASYFTSEISKIPSTTTETVNGLFSDSADDEDDEFCDDNFFIPKPTVDKSTSTSEL